MKRDQPVRILHIFAGMNRGGAETLIMNIYRNIDRTKVQFDFAVETNKRCHYDDEIISLGGRIIPILDPVKSGSLSYGKVLYSKMKYYGPFIGVHSHVHYFSGFVLQIAKIAAIPIRIAHSHTTLDGKQDSWKRKFYRRAMKFLILRNATDLLGCSRVACESLYGNKCWEDNRIKLIHNALNLSLYENLNKDKKLLRKKLQLPEDKLIIGHVGRFNEVKNHSFLISIFYSLHKLLPNSHLVLVGDGPLRNNIESLIREFGLENCVHLLGVRDDVPEIMGSLDLFLFTSIYEGLGNVLIEAQAAGVPCVSSDKVPVEADLNCGLIKRISLNEKIELWVEQIINLLKTNTSVDWENRKNALLSEGYDISLVSSKIEKFYLKDL